MLQLVDVTCAERSSMQDYFDFDESELEKVGVRCVECATETVFDLRRDQAAHAPRLCPAATSPCSTSFSSTLGNGSTG
jgi:hypothetical protein